MAENESFFRKVVRFVANPATDWTDLSSRQDDSRELELEKSELKAMIERKRRNDFVRKREFDTLRRVRREGLTPEQAAALEGSSRLEDSEVRLASASVRPDGAVKAKIDEIERQMERAEHSYVNTRRAAQGAQAGAAAANELVQRQLQSPQAPQATLPTTLPPTNPHTLPPPAAPTPPGKAAPSLREMLKEGATALRFGQAGAPPAAAGGGHLGASLDGHFDLNLDRMAGARTAPSVEDGFQAYNLRGSGASGLPPAGFGEPAATEPAGAYTAPHGLPPSSFDPTGPAINPGATAAGSFTAPGAYVPAPLSPGLGQQGPAIEVNEAQHDPELDEAVIAFANADFEICEQALRRLIGRKGSRAQHAETWMVLFDLYRATGLQPQFESLAVAYAQQFGSSAPQWFSLPKLVADAAASRRSTAAPALEGAEAAGVGWACPAVLDVEALARLRAQALQLPMPWVFDWSALQSMAPEAAMQLSTQFRLWAGQPVEMRWLAGERLLQVLAEAAPTGVRDADPAFWLTRLEALRLANRADQFDEAAIDYCVTYEVSPPSWEAARCKVSLLGAGTGLTRLSAAARLGEVTSGFSEPAGLEGAAQTGVAKMELSGQLLGDISQTLHELQAQLSDSTIVTVSCAKLIRVDFIAAGDLLNWVLARRGEGRAVQLTEAHRLVALFFGAMGINEHARVQVRKV